MILFNNIRIATHLSHGHAKIVGSRNDLHFVIVIHMLTVMCNRSILLYAMFSTTRYYVCITYFVQHNVRKS